MAETATLSRPQIASWLARNLGAANPAPMVPEDVEALALLVDERCVAGGTGIFARHELPGRVYVVRSGAVELTRKLSGRRVTLQLLREGDVFGDVPLLLRRPEPFDACAIEDSLVYAIESMAFVKLLAQRPALAKRWMISMADRLADTQERVSDLLSGNLEGQIASYLLHQNGGDELDISQETLARLLGARRTSVNQALGRLEKQGLISTRYRHISVVDRPALERRVNT